MAVSAAYQPSIMVVDDDEDIRAMICRHFRRAGMIATEMKDAESAIESYDEINPTAVISDVKMPKMTGLDLLTALKKKNNNAIVVLMSGHGDKQILFEALRGGATGFFQKPFNLGELTSFVLRAIRQSRDPSIDHLLSPHLASEHKRYEFGSHGIDIAPIVDQITLNLKLWVSESELVNLRIGIYEMIENAIEHGNLGISFNEKTENIAEGTYAQLVNELAADPENKDKRVRVESEFKNGEFQVTIDDDGDGFDWRRLSDFEMELQSLYNGRGIILTEIYYDDVSYNEKGNAVTLTKYLETR